MCKNSFLPSNEFVGVHKSTQRINVVRKISTKQSHITHADSHAHNVLWRIVKDTIFSLNLEVKKLMLNEVIFCLIKTVLKRMSVQLCSQVVLIE